MIFVQLTRKHFMLSVTTLGTILFFGGLSFLFVSPASSQEVPSEEVPSTPEEGEVGGSTPTALIPITVLIFGQSNASGATGPCPYSLQNEHSEVTIYDGTFTGSVANPIGAPWTEYPNFVGAECFIADELLSLGYDPTIIIRAIPGSNIETSRNILVPALRDDVAALALQPDVIFSWQGEADARTETLGYLYRERLIGPYGPTGNESVLGNIRSFFGDIPWYVVALRVRDTDYAPYHRVVRAAHYQAGVHPQVCTLESFDAPLLPGDNQPHVSVDGLEVVGRRAAQSIANNYICP